MTCYQFHGSLSFPSNKKDFKHTFHHFNQKQISNTHFHSFKNKHGLYPNIQLKLKFTATASTLLKSLISRAADDDSYVVMASLDLSAAFDLVNVELLIRRLKIMDLGSSL